MSSTSANRVLVIGACGVGKKYLLHQLGASAAAATGPSAAAAPTALTHHTLPLDTKYYTTSINVSVLPGATHAAFADSEDERLSAEDRAAFTAQEVHAALLVFDRRRPATFHALASAWTAFLDERQPEVAMLIGNEPTNEQSVAASKDEIAPSPDDLAELEQLARDWALDHQCEYVQMPFGDVLQSANVRLAVPATAASSSSSRPRSSSHDDSDDVDLQAANEPIGLARIRESLECNAWPQLQMKERKAATKRPVYSHEDDEDEMKEEEQKSHTDGNTVPAASRMIDDSEEFAAFVSAIENADPNVAAPQPAAPTAAAANTAADASSTAAAAVATSPKPAAKPATSTARSASASAFANAFANAIRVPDTATKSAPVITSSNNPSQSVAPTSQLSTPDDAEIDGPLGRDASLDLLAERLTRLTPEEAAENKTNTAAVVPVDEEDSEDPSQTEASMAAFEGLFEKVTAMKNELARASREGTMTDAERRAKAEANVRMLLKSLGMEGELDSDIEETEA